ncbi:SIS domain-containing protein [Mycetocola tolaasinivorans]|uniref:SIS domain-containing protein n=1 Tax=Mycetocola tolaasinivorans TaxID=76635 RepID=A0A3L7A7L7_9MICO|nr:SIS domain-containing protein [Mycetocola tolaasinivorans]RLP75571.1 SIS domain-containing protein [Mycetocola tolaasinivorans]
MSNPSALVINAARAFIEEESSAVHDIADQIDETFVRVADLVLRGTGKVVITGAGTSGFIARRAAHLFSVSGTPAFFLNPTDGLHGSMGVLEPDDILIAMSKGGGSSEVNELVDRSRTNGVTVVALTCAPESRLGTSADITVALREFPSADPGALIAMGSTLAHGSWLDALALVIMRARGFEWERVHYIHPGGAVGQLSTLPEQVAPLEIPTFESEPRS